MSSFTSNSSATGPRALAAVALFLLVGVIGLEILARLFPAPVDLAKRPFEIRSPAELCAKLSVFDAIDGETAILIGDSLALGEVMQDHGQAEWRDHTLAAALEREAAARGESLTVLNLGFNGLLPADARGIVRWAADTDADAIVMNLSLRSFSADFKAPESSNSRQWMGGLGDTLCAIDPSTTDATAHRLATALQRSALARSITLARPQIFDGSLRAAVAQWWSRFPSSTAVADVTPPDRNKLMQLLAQAKTRYGSVMEQGQLTGPQFDALQGLVAETDTPLLMFYAEEDRLARRSLLKASEYEKARSQLREALAGESSRECLVYSEDYEAVERTQYLDYVHLDSAGYANLASQFYPVLTDLMSKDCTAQQ